MDPLDSEYDLEKMKAKWAAEVGRFVMAFGSIEGSTYYALRPCARDPIAQPLIDANLALKPRLDLLIAIAGAREGKRWESFASTLNKVKALAGKRNLIAHNGVGLDVFIDAAGEYFVEEGISNAKKWPVRDKKLAAKDRIAFDELTEHRKEAEALSLELSTGLFKLLELVGGELAGDMEFVKKRQDL